MCVKERILAIRLTEKVMANPAHTKALGIVVRSSRTKPTRQTVSASASQ